MNKTSEQVNGGSPGSPSVFQIKLTFWRASFAALLWALSGSARRVLGLLLLGPAQSVRERQVDSELFPATLRLREIFLLLEPAAVLLAAMILYFSVAQKGNGQEGRVRRGEIFTGMINIHIALLLLASLLIPHLAGRFDPLALGMVLLAAIVETAVACVVAFHLCEGRLFLPIAGFLISSAALPVLIRYSIPTSSHPFFVAFTGAALLNLVWQLGTLISSRSGFDMFPTGLLPAVKRCGRVLIPISLAFWILTGQAWICVEAIFSGSAQMSKTLSGKTSVTAYGILSLVLLALLQRPDDDFRRRSRGIVILALIGFVVLGAGGSAIGSRQFRLSGFAFSFGPSLLENLFRLVLLSMCGFFVPLCLVRWWARGRFAKPLVLGTLAYGFHLVTPIVVSLAESGHFSWLFITSEALGVLFVVLTLLRPTPPSAREAGSAAGENTSVGTQERTV